METVIPFYDKTTGVASKCGEPLEISVSSRDLGWDGVLVERGTSPYFFPKDVVNPGFYFAIELESSYDWLLEKDGAQIESKTERGDIWINPPNTPFTHNIEVPCNFLIVVISEERMFSSFDGIVPEGLVFLNNYNIQDHMLQNLMMMLFHEVEAKGANNPWLVDKAMSIFSNYFLRHYSNYYDCLEKKVQNSIIGEDELYRINAYINSNLSNGITIDDLANELRISKFHFLSEFKKTTGITPYQHLSKMRIDLAKKLLHDNEYSITEIAYELGFSDNSHFSRSFKKAIGLSPRKYRDNFKE